MKIEKINDNQIRCTLTPQDLKTRDIRISELTYGSGKARSLFREMMKQAFHDYGFRIDNTPLMVEAMPDKDGNLTLVITKVRDPEEIDSRFAHFTSDPSGEEYSFNSLSRDMPGADDILKSLKRLLSQDDGEDFELAADGISGPAEHGTSGNVSGTGSASAEHGPSGRGTDASGSAGHGPSDRGTGTSSGSALVPSGGKKAEGAGKTSGQTSGQLNTLKDEELFGYTRFYMFHTLESVIRASRNIGKDYAGGSTLFKNPDDGEYYLLIRKEETGPERFNQICNIFSEYGLPMDFVSGTDEFFHEHMKVIVADRAVQQLGTL